MKSGIRLPGGYIARAGGLVWHVINAAEAAVIYALIALPIIAPVAAMHLITKIVEVLA